MASTRTAIPPVSQKAALSQRGTTPQKPASIRTAPLATTPLSKGPKPPVEGVIEAHSDFLAFLYKSHGPTYDENATKLEQSTGAKREHFAYGLAGFLALYLIAGNSAQFICNLIGFAYPAYVSVKAVRSEDKSDDTQWLIYWTVFAFFSMVDFFFMGIMSWMNIYWLLKAAFLVYLYLPQTMGAQTLYASVVDPLAKKLEALLEKKQA